jgi:hypothetical protein
MSAEVTPGPALARAAVVVVVLAATVAVLAIVGWPASQYRHNDFAGFWVGSRMLLDGVDPYDFEPFLAMHRAIGSQGLAINPPGTAYGYPLTAALVFSPFALLPVEIAAPLWFVTQVALASVALVLLGRQLYPATLRRDTVALLGIGAASQPAWLLAAGGNLGGYLLAITAASSAFLLARRPFVAGAIAGLLIVKPHPLLAALLVVALALPRRDALRAAAGALAVAGPILLITLALRPGWIGEFLLPFTRIAGAPVPRSTLFGLVPPDLRAAAIVIAIAIVATAAVWARLRRPDLAVVIAAAVPVSLFVIPYGWSYDHLVMLVSAAVILALAADAPPARRTAMLAGLAVVFVLLTWTLFSIAFQRGNEALTALTPLAVLALVFLALRARETPYRAERAH